MKYILLIFTFLRYTFFVQAQVWRINNNRV